MLTALLFATAMATADVPRVTVSPQPAWIEADLTRQSLNVDLIIENPTSEPLDLDEIQLSVHDRSGALVLRRFLDGNGTRPSIRTADLPTIPAHSQSMLFNPFSQFDPGADLHTLQFALKLSSKDGKRIYPASVEVRPQVYRTKSRLILPVSHRMIVYDGHDFFSHHRRWDYTIPGLQQLGFHTNFMRYSYDFVPVDAHGDMASGPANENGSWFGFGLPVRAVAGGVIAAAFDRAPDDRTFDPASIAAGGTAKLWGNYLVIDHGNGEFSLYGHIRQGSSKVTIGQRVRSGEVIAAIGAAGSSKFPHLHFELQTGTGTDSEGLPSVFHDFERILGNRRVHVKSGLVDTGDILEAR